MQMRILLKQMSGAFAMILFFVLTSVDVASAADANVRGDIRPRVSDLRVRLLKAETEEGNIVASANLTANQKLPDRIRIYLDNNERWLHDDGAQGDDKKGDGRYSMILSIPISQLEKLGSGSTPTGSVKTRQIWGPRARIGAESVRPFDFAGLQAGRMVELSQAALSLPPTVWERCLMITTTDVTDDQRAQGLGPWSFGYIVSNIAQQASVPAERFVRKWLQNWEATQGVNGFEAKQRLGGITDFITAWPKNANGELDLSRAPFRLLAIVHRIDLRNDILLGGPGSAGENRFVFCAVNAAGDPLPFTVIFEFGILAADHLAVKQEAQRWFALNQWETNTDIYKSALEALTELFVNSNSSGYNARLDQVRTNEIALAFPWELREFKLTQDPNEPVQHKYLVQTTVKQTPDTSFATDVAKKLKLAGWAAMKSVDILNGSHVLPDVTPPDTALLAADSLEIGTVWLNDAGLTSQVRHMFAIQTCNGCHEPETNTGFTHINPRLVGSPASLSGFMTGIAVNDPSNPSLTRFFSERTRRLIDFEELLNSPDVLQLLRPATSFVH